MITPKIGYLEQPLQLYSVGTGRALNMGTHGKVDVVLVHAPDAEKLFVESGFGVNRRGVMYNDFVIVGPKSDPADVKGSKNSMDALRRIMLNSQQFISRGDDSGTHKKELALWKAAEIAPFGPWYVETGKNMKRALQMAADQNQYTLTDRGTWLSMDDQSTLQILFEGGKLLHNPYGIIAVNPEKIEGVNHKGALAFIEWITSKIGQDLIREFRIKGQIWFVPSAAIP
jgi:tungstate transport system substrate-binding protein